MEDEKKVEQKTDKKVTQNPKDEQKNRMGKTKDMVKKVPVGPGNFWNNMLSTVLLLILLTAGYSYLSESKEEPEEVAISEIAQQVANGEVTEIIVRGSKLEVTYTDETRTMAEAKKETDAAVTETLVALGVSQEALQAITIDVQNETGFAFWAGALAPFLFPIIFLLLIIWFFTRSVKGGGMQALNFGNSKARVIDPNDQTQKVTFKDNSW
jgi:ATP-dependent Zn protease